MFNQYLEDTKVNYITLTNFHHVTNRQDLNQLKELVKINIKNINYPLINKSTGYKVTISSKSIGKMLLGTSQKIIIKMLFPAPYFNPFIKDYINNLNFLLKIEDLFINAIYIGSFKQMKNKNSKSIFHHFVAPIKINNSSYKIFITIYNNSLYSINSKFIKETKEDSIKVKELVDNIELYNYQIKNYELININTMRHKNIIKEDRPIYIG